MSLDAKIMQAQELLAGIAAGFPAAALANSLGAEDMVLMDLTARAGVPLAVFCLDTGRLPAETYDFLARLSGAYPQHPVEVWVPENGGVQAYVAQFGINGFYDSVAARQACCAARKLEPLGRALAGRGAWVTGLRRTQSVTRSALAVREDDPVNGLVKFSPLADWSEAEVWEYVHRFSVPYNALHDRHYPSIGCAPCTRAVAVGEDVRAGRWWWENPEHKECGLHRKPA